MAFASVEFIGFIILSVAALRLTPPGVLKRWLALILSLAFDSTFARSPAQFLPLTLFLAVGYIAVQMVARFKARAVIGALIVLLVAAFAWMKQYAVLKIVGIPTFPILTIGLSYLLFRVLHLIIDVAEGELPPPALLDYLNYNLFFLSFVSGPIQRFEEFQAQIGAHPRPQSFEEVNDAFHRIVLGYFMVVVISSTASSVVQMGSPYLSTALQAQHAISTLRIYDLLVAAYLINMFANFAGYMHIVIGVGLLAGFRLPENFNHPFVSRNFADFWSRGDFSQHRGERSPQDCQDKY